MKLRLLFVFFLSFLLFSRSSSQTDGSNPPATCPINFDDVLAATMRNTCCQSLLSLIGISLAQRLKQTSKFRLPDLASSVACLRDFQAKLDSLSLPKNLTSSCFDPSQFVITPETCAHIQTTQDWVDRLGESTQLDSACAGDLTDLTRCDACVSAGFRVHSQLLAIDGNNTRFQNCYHLTVLYAAGIVNKLGPESEGSLTCMFSLTLNAHVGSKAKSRLGLVLGIFGGIVAFLALLGLVGLYWWRERVCKARKFGLEELQGSRPKLRPNTGSIWFKIHDLEKATNNFSQKNFIGRDGFGFVYKGVLPDGSMIAVKKIIESDFQGDAEFRNEVEIISNLKHRNLVPLRGCCVVDGDEHDYNGESERYLVYEFMPNGNLDYHLFPSLDAQGETQKKPLSWPRGRTSSWTWLKG